MYSWRFSAVTQEKKTFMIIMYSTIYNNPLKWVHSEMLEAHTFPPPQLSPPTFRAKILRLSQRPQSNTLFIIIRQKNLIPLIPRLIRSQKRHTSEFLLLGKTPRPNHPSIIRHLLSCKPRSPVVGSGLRKTRKANNAWL